MLRLFHGEWHLMGAPVTLGLVQPLGLRRMIIGQRGRLFAAPGARAACWISRMASNARSIATAIAWCIISGSWPATSIGS
jgi:hypothetical protein